MEDFTKIVRIGTRKLFEGGKTVSVFCSITYKGERLSITGVEGPTPNGNVHGSYGQIYDELQDAKFAKFAPEWDAGTLARFLQIWEEWRLNDLRPYSPEMKAAGWHLKAETPMRGQRFTLTAESIKAKRAVEEAALEALRAGRAFVPSGHDVRDASRPFSVTLWSYESEPASCGHLTTCVASNPSPSPKKRRIDRPWKRLRRHPCRSRTSNAPSVSKGRFRRLPS